MSLTCDAACSNTHGPATALRTVGSEDSHARRPDRAHHDALVRARFLCDSAAYMGLDPAPVLARHVAAPRLA